MCVFKDGIFYEQTEATKILFHPLTEEKIHMYHRHCYFPDAAGGYDIAGKGIIIVQKIEGCFYNVLGLPINSTRDLLLKAGINLWDYLS